MQEEDGKDDDDVDNAQDAAHVTHLKNSWSWPSLENMVVPTNLLASLSIKA